MDDLMKMVMEKANISEMASQIAIKTVADFLSDKLPAPIAAQVQSALTGEAGGMLGGLAKGFMGGDDEDGPADLGAAFGKLL